MSFETDLDKYLTTPPDDNSLYYEKVYDLISEETLSEKQYNEAEKELDEIISSFHVLGFDAEQTATAIKIFLESNFLGKVHFNIYVWF